MPRIAPWLSSPLVVVAIACSGGDRLKPGQEAMVVGSRPDAVGVILKADANGPDVPGQKSVSVGSKVRVVGDAEPNDAAHPGNRGVRVNVLEGDHKGEAGSMRRKNLAPIE